MKMTQKLVAALVSITVDKLLVAIKERVTIVHDTDAKAVVVLVLPMPELSNTLVRYCI
jgi:hypothetical protein